MMNSKLFFIAVFCLFLVSCGYDGEEEKEAARKEDLQELSEEMNQNLTTITGLKVQLRDSLDDLGVRGDSTEQLRVDKYRLLLAELDQTEVAYRDWEEEVNAEMENIAHEEAMAFYDQQEEKAQSLRMDMRSKIKYVQQELETPVVETP
jgi:uncharacterized FlaG/YvyC family protein